MIRFFLYFRLQYKLLTLLMVIILPAAILCLDIIGLELLSTQVLLFGVLVFLRIGFNRTSPSFLQVDLKRFVQNKIQRVPSNKDLTYWQGLNLEAQDAVFIMVGLFILSLHLTH